MALILRRPTHLFCQRGTYLARDIGCSIQDIQATVVVLLYSSMYIPCRVETIYSPPRPPAYRQRVSVRNNDTRTNPIYFVYGQRQRSGPALTSFMHALPLCASSLPSSLATSAKDIPLSVFFCRSFATRECTASIVAAIVTRRLSSSRVSVSKTKPDQSSRGNVVLATQYVDMRNK